MGTNQESFDRRMAFVGAIVRQFGLQMKNISPLAYSDEHPAEYNNFIYKVELESPAVRSSFPAGQPCTEALPPGDGVSAVVVSLSNLRAQGLNNVGRVSSQVACVYLARQAIEKAQLEQLIPAIYAWSGPRSLEEVKEENFGWIVSEFKEGEDLDSQMSSLSTEDKAVTLDTIAKYFAALQKIEVPSTADKFGGLAFESNGKIVSTQMALAKGGPFNSYADVWAMKLQGELEESKPSPELNGWEENGIAERVRSFIAGGGVSKALEGVDLSHRGFVHSDFTTNNILYDAKAKRLTAILDFDWACITHPAEEFLSGFYDLGGCMRDRSKAVVSAILSNDFSEQPEGLSEDEAKHWATGKLWAEASTRNNVTVPSKISGIQKIAALNTFNTALCPFELSHPGILNRQSAEVRARRKQQYTDTIVQFLQEHGH